MTKVELALNTACEAFWQAVAEEFPEVTSGDFPPDAQMQLEQSIRSAIELWLHYNAPEKCES